MPQTYDYLKYMTIVTTHQVRRVKQMKTQYQCMIGVELYVNINIKK